MTDEEPKPQFYRIRISEWTEWMPVFGDAATEGQLVYPNWHTFLEADPREKLSDIVSTNTGQSVERWVINNDDESQTVLLEGVEPEQDAIDAKRAVKARFVLYHFTATLVSHADVDAAPAPMLVSKFERSKPSALVTAPSGAIPKNRAQRRAR